MSWWLKKALEGHHTGDHLKTHRMIFSALLAKASAPAEPRVVKKTQIEDDAGASSSLWGFSFYILWECLSSSVFCTSST